MTQEEKNLAKMELADLVNSMEAKRETLQAMQKAAQEDMDVKMKEIQELSKKYHDLKKLIYG